MFIHYDTAVHAWAWLGVKYYGGSGLEVRSPPEATDILSKENTFFKRWPISIKLQYITGSTITNEHVGFFRKRI